MAFNVRGKGLVVLSSCSHSGVINVLRHVQRVTGVDHIHGFIGGLHLTGGLLRQYFPKGTDMAALTQADLDKAAHSLNGRPRQTLDGMTPSEKLAEVLQ